MFDDGPGRDARYGCDDVVGAHALGFALCDELVRDRIAEELAAGRFRRVEGEVGEGGEEGVDHGLVDGAGRAHSAVSVEFLRAGGEVTHRGVDEDVAGAGVEVVEGWIEGAWRGVVGRDEADVGDAADVLTGAEFGWVVQEEGVEEGDEWCPLPAGGLVADAEVGHGGDAGAGGEDGAFGHGKGGFDLGLLRHAEEPDGLAVGAESVDGGEGDGVFGGEGEDGGGEGLTQEDIDFGEFFGGGFVVEDHVHDALFDCLFEGYFIVFEEFEVHG